jgi:GNAT superfamily N-acetyltransferase
MSLDLTSTAMQVDGMSADLVSRLGHREGRLRNALRALQRCDVDEYTARRDMADRDSAWNTPEMGEDPATRHDLPLAPDDFIVAAVDGSHIDVDRHLPARCFLINTGHAVLTYGKNPAADLDSEPRLYASDADLSIRDPLSYRQQSIEGALLGAKRAVEEIRKLVELVRALPDDVPALALLDGSLMMLGLAGPANQAFVLEELVENGFASALDELRELAESRPLAVASYISLPRHSEVANGLRLLTCEATVRDGMYPCSSTDSEWGPCGPCVGGIMDREMFAAHLETGQRSAMFTTTSPDVDKYYRGTGLSFYYLNAGEEIARVEVPSWVAEREEAVDLTHSLLVDQCKRGHGYPVALMESHEQAVVSGADRRHFVGLVEGALQDRGLAVYTSEKALSKRMRWL